MKHNNWRKNRGNDIQILRMEIYIFHQKPCRPWLTSSSPSLSVRGRRRSWRWRSPRRTASSARRVSCPPRCSAVPCSLAGISRLTQTQLSDLSRMWIIFLDKSPPWSSQNFPLQSRDNNLTNSLTGGKRNDIFQEHWRLIWRVRQNLKVPIGWNSS